MASSRTATASSIVSACSTAAASIASIASRIVSAEAHKEDGAGTRRLGSSSRYGERAAAASARLSAAPKSSSSDSLPSLSSATSPGAASTAGGLVEGTARQAWAR
jgi:hypothetical protein